MATGYWSLSSPNTPIVEKIWDSCYYQTQWEVNQGPSEVGWVVVVVVKVVGRWVKSESERER
ncbi:hypothetical protein Hanom_Chr12g01095761 [Helianthus anomalus]